MVSVLVQRQQHETARRKERLRAAHQAAAALSIQQARAYQKQKRQQEACVREDARQLWLQSNARDLAAIERLVARATTEQGEAEEAAGHYEANLQAEACEEAAAWQAERQLEEARHRLAVAYTRTQTHERTKPARQAEQRRTAVRVTEKVRAARVAAAAPAALSLSSVLGSLQGAPVATHVPRASVPVPRPSLEPLRNVAGSTAGAALADAPPAAQSPLRRWRISHVAPHVHVTLHGDPTHRVTAREENEISALAAADDAVPASADAYAAECAAVQQQRDEVLKVGRERAAQRAASLLRHQRAKELQEEEEQQTQRERLAAVKERYRHPHEEGAPSGGKKAAAPEVGTHPATATTGSSSGSNGSPNHQHRRPQRQRTPQRLACHQQAYIKGEEEFRAAFVEAPPLVVRLDEEPPRRAPLSELLRPVKVAELLYSIANSVPVDPTPVTPAPHHGSGAAAAGSPSFPMTDEVLPSAQPSARARVLPSVPLRMLPLDERSSAARAKAESAPEDRAAATTPLSSGEEGCSLPPPPPAPRGSSGAPRASLRASAEASTAPSPMRLDVPVSRTSRARTPSPEKAATVEELVALSPLTPAPPAAGTCVPESPSPPPPCAGGALRELAQTAANMGASDVTMAYRQQPLTAPGGRRATSAHENAPASPSALSSMMERTPAHHRHRRSATPPSSLSSSTTTTTETAEPPSGSSSPASVEGSSSSGTDASSSSYDSASTSGSSRHPMPVMTAEQLKLALLRLRSRIRSAQM
ncbi:hypothetical protein conserved [Leishmania donovani]|uniref:Hypothetical_protein_conserved n=1 Tax=Leishmania donovani TaxID=5661 RepID=A0A6J8F715_LEIDO|nr:hypothetical protein conserved [Leishmania donovani]VDZ41890.1 hypothetical_protein_conserved [Leishmania donovani]